MSIYLPWIIMLLMFFIFLPVVAVCAVTSIRYIYRKIRKRKTISAPKFIAVTLIAIIGIALLPPIPFMAVESLQTDITITGRIATLTYDTDDPNIRYIEYDGTKYQELDTSISDVEYYDYSEDADLEYGEPLANVVFDNQSFIEKYIYTVFRYPVHSQLIYSVKNEGMGDYISLEGTSLFCEVDTIDERLAYYKDTKNYDYYIEDYNADEYFDIEIDNDSIEEIRTLAHLKYEYEYDDTEESMEANIPGIIKLEVDSDYDMLTLLGESKNKLILREIGMIYTDEKNRMYQVVEEIWRYDGSVALLVLEVSDQTTAKLTKAFSEAGIK